MNRITETEFLVYWDGSQWCVSVDGDPIAFGSTPVSAMINAEVSIRR